MERIFGRLPWKRIFGQLPWKRKFEEGPMAGYVVAPDMSHVDNTFTFSATSSPAPAAPKAKKFKPLPPSGIVAPHMSHVDNTFTFSATSSSTSAAPKARRKKKFKPSPPSGRSPLQDFDEKFTNMMGHYTDDFGTFFQDKLSASAFVPPVKATEIIRRGRQRIFEDLDMDMCYRPESVVPPHIKEFCDFALEKYNNEHGTSYRYLFPIVADEDVKADDTSHSFIFMATVSDDYHFEAFIAKIKSFGFSEGRTSYVKELQEVSHC